MKKTGSNTAFEMLVLMTCLVLLSACSTVPTEISTVPPLYLSHDLPVEVEDADVLALNEEMQAFLDRYVRPYENQHTRVELLTRAVISSAVLGYKYEERKTLTASSSFNARVGNCVGFSNMMVALAREAGLDAYYQEVLQAPQWSSEDQTLLMSKHMNVVVDVPGRQFMVDTSGIEIQEDDVLRPLQDEEALALYYNNLGIEAMVKGDSSRAWSYLVKATETAPAHPDAWVNLGVLYSRNEQLDEAMEMYQTALTAEPNQVSALSNLYELYMENDAEELAEAIAPKVERYRRNNPYYLMKLGYEAVETQQYEQATDWFEQAIKLNQDEHLFHYGLAQARHLSGATEAAAMSLEKAIELAPRSYLTEYRRPLEEVVLEY